MRALSAAVSAYSSHLGPQLSAALAYHVLLSLFPLLIFLVAILGLALNDEATRERVVDWLLDLLPVTEDARDTVESAVEGISTPASAAGLLSLIPLIWAASGAMAAIRKGLDVVWKPEQRRPAGRAKLLDVLLVLLAGAFVLVSVGLTVIIQVALDRADLGAFEAVVSAAGELTRLALPFLFTFATFVLLYARVPWARPPFRTVWLGALVAALAFEVLKVGFGIYLSHFANYNLIYGSSVPSSASSCSRTSREPSSSWARTSRRRGRRSASRPRRRPRSASPSCIGHDASCAGCSFTSATLRARTPEQLHPQGLGRSLRWRGGRWPILGAPQIVLQCAGNRRSSR